MTLCILIIPLCVHAGSIFDDNWVPPQPAKPSVPASAPATKPAEPPLDATGTKSVPLPATRDVPANPLPSNTVQQPSAPAARRPVPSAVEQAKSRALFKEVFAKELADRSPAARRSLAAKLLQQATSVSDAPTDEFVLLVGATRAASDGSDLGVCCHAADALADAYDVDRLRFKADIATKMALRADSAAITADNCLAGLKLVDQLAVAEDFTGAQRLLKALRAVAPTTALSSEIQSRAKDVDARQTAAARFNQSLQALKAAPEDAAANLAVGQYLCFVKGDWAAGLPLLAKSGKAGDHSFAAAANQEMANPIDPQAQLAVGDLWRSLSENSKAEVKIAAARRAAFWYHKAMPGLSGLAKLAAQKRLSELGLTPELPRLVLFKFAPEGEYPLVPLADPAPDALTFAQTKTGFRLSGSKSVEAGMFAGVPRAHFGKAVIINGTEASGSFRTDLPVVPHDTRYFMPLVDKRGHCHESPLNLEQGVSYFWTISEKDGIVTAKVTDRDKEILSTSLPLQDFESFGFAITVRWVGTKADLIVSFD